jgi:hypothetical protein
VSGPNVGRGKCIECCELDIQEATSIAAATTSSTALTATASFMTRMDATFPYFGLTRSGDGHGVQSLKESHRVREFFSYHFKAISHLTRLFLSA